MGIFKFNLKVYLFIRLPNITNKDECNFYIILWLVFCRRSNSTFQSEIFYTLSSYYKVKTKIYTFLSKTNYSYIILC